MSMSDIEMFVQTITNSLPADKDRLNVYCEAQATDPDYSSLIAYCVKSQTKRQNGQFRGEFSRSDLVINYYCMAQK